MRRFRRRFTGRKANYHWCRKLQTIADLRAGSNTVDLLQPSDYNSNTALSPSGVTVVRVVVDFAWQYSSSNSAQDLSVLHWMLWECDADAANLAVATQNLTDERILSCGTSTFQASSSAGVWTNQFEGPHRHIDTKVKVKLKDSDLRLSFTETGWDAGAIPCFIISSVLLRGDTT